MNITVAKSWQELSPWQLQEIIDIYLNHPEEQWEKAFEKMILILFQKKNGFWARMRLRKLIKQVPVSTLAEFGEFLLEPPKLHQFPDIDGVIKPADRLGDLSIAQFSFMDQFFHVWTDSKSDKYLRALCAAIYRVGEFDNLKLPEVAKYTDKLNKKERQVIGFIYMSCYHHLADQFPVVFPKPVKKEGEEKVQKPAKKPVFKPFSEIILNIVMHEETQPLGNLHESNKTRIYEFMNVFTRIILKNQKLEQEYAKRK